jgi:hypothetical protein
MVVIDDDYTSNDSFFSWFVKKYDIHGGTLGKEKVKDRINDLYFTMGKMGATKILKLILSKGMEITADYFINSSFYNCVIRGFDHLFSSSTLDLEKDQEKVNQVEEFLKLFKNNQQVIYDNLSKVQFKSLKFFQIVINLLSPQKLDSNKFRNSITGQKNISIVKWILDSFPKNISSSYFFKNDSGSDYNKSFFKLENLELLMFLIDYAKTKGYTELIHLGNFFHYCIKDVGFLRYNHNRSMFQYSNLVELDEQVFRLVLRYNTRNTQKFGKVEKFQKLFETEIYSCTIVVKMFDHVEKYLEEVANLLEEKTKLIDPIIDIILSFI